MQKAKLIVAFVLAVVVQLGLLAAVPAKRYIPVYAGKVIRLKVMPVDPYSPYRGYYMTLRFEISRPEDKDIQAQLDQLITKDVFVVLTEGEDGFWHIRSLHPDRPEDIPQGTVVICGKAGYHRISYGIESYYVPEDKAGHIERDLRAHIDKAVAEVAVGPFGNAALIRLRVEDRVYEY